MLLIICSQMNSTVRIVTISENILRAKIQPRYGINCETFEMVSHNPLCINVVYQYVKYILGKKVAVLLDFVQMRGGGLPKFFVHFSQTVYIGSIWGWGGRGRPLDKIQKNSYFFSGVRP